MAHYALTFRDPAGHVLDIEISFAHPAPEQKLSMPSWIPGSYLMREFARHVINLSAEQSGQALAVSKVDKSTWSVRSNPDSPLHVRYRVYAWDRSVRGCHFDTARAFINPAACLLQDASSPDNSCVLDIHPPAFPGGELWRCATTMAPVAVSERGFGRYHAASYDELIDHPLECADFDEFGFEAGGVPHRFVVTGRHRGDLQRLQADAQKICQGHCDLFGAPPPFAAYLFQLHVVDDGYGGLEHRSSTALIIPRNDLPAPGESAITEGYRELLGLISHEYFHAWNVKKIRPAAFDGPHGYNTSVETYTRLLWLFEGFTSYYDDLMLKRVGLVSDADYLKLIGRRLTQLLRSPGRHVQSVADASFDAWIKYYRADENAVNSQFSYYLRGSFVALALDLMQRAAGEDAPSLDSLMQALWREFGQSGRGVPEDIEPCFSRWAQRDLGAFFARYVNGTEDPDWSALFAPFGIEYRTRPAASAADRGGRDDPDATTNARTLGLQIGDGGVMPVLKQVLAGSAAWQAGLGAGDMLVAVDGLRASSATLGKHLARFRTGEQLNVVYFRYDELRSTTIEIPEPQHDTVWLETRADDPSGAARRARWLGNVVSA